MRFYIILATIIAVVAVAGCVGQGEKALDAPYPGLNITSSEQAPGSVESASRPVTSETGAKWGFDYCACGLHQQGDPMAETQCYNIRWQCIDSDKDPGADPCIIYKEITDLYQEGNCKPNWGNPEAKTLYCVAMVGTPRNETVNSFLLETCGPGPETISSPLSFYDRYSQFHTVSWPTSEKCASATRMDCIAGTVCRNVSVTNECRYEELQEYCRQKQEAGEIWYRVNGISTGAVNESLRNMCCSTGVIC